jgi:hypothetical protein
VRSPTSARPATGPTRRPPRGAEKRVTTFQKARDELAQFIASRRTVRREGPAAPDAKCPEREVDARYVPDLDDGVMINSAALWPLLAPQWKDPKKWWKELAAADGKKDYDWSHLAMRYWPTRVDAKCKKDPSLAVAHGCFWKYHPARAWAWELRLQDEIGPGFRIEEAPYRGDGGHEAHRTALIADHPVDALAAVEKEALRRIRKHKRRLGELVVPRGGAVGRAAGPVLGARAAGDREAGAGLQAARARRARGPGRVRAAAPRAGEEAARPAGAACARPIS